MSRVWFLCTFARETDGGIDFINFHACTVAGIDLWGLYPKHVESNEQFVVFVFFCLKDVEESLHSVTKVWWSKQAATFSEDVRHNFVTKKVLKCLNDVHQCFTILVMFLSQVV